MSNSKYRDSSLHHFELNKLKTSANPESYIENLLLKSISEEYKGKIDLTLSELQDVLKGVGIHLTSSQSAQVYKRSLVSNKIRASTSMVTNLGIVQQNRLNFQLAAKWIHYYIGGVSTTSVLKNKSSINIAHVPSSNERGRSDIGSKVANARIYAQLKQIWALFEEIDKNRVQYGIVEQEGGTQLEKQGSYLTVQERNSHIGRLRKDVEDKLQMMIRMSKHYPQLRRIIQCEMSAAIKDQLTHNLKTGRMGAMKAQRRLIQDTQHKIKKIEQTRIKLKFVPFTCKTEAVQ